MQHVFNLATLTPLLPEIVVALGAMGLLMVGAFRPGGEASIKARDGEVIGWAAIAVLAVALYFVLDAPVTTVSLFDGAFISDGFARFMKVLILVGAAASLLLSFDYLREHVPELFEYPVLVLLCVVGMMMMVSAGDLIALYLAIELQSLALYVLAAIRRDDVKSSEAGLKYFVLGALSSGMLLYGASLIYGFTGSTSLAVIAQVAQTGGANIGLIVGLVFLMVGIAFKISAVPFHMWTPDVYEGAPTPVTAFFAAVPKLAAMALLVRVLSTGFPAVAGGVKWQQIIVFLSLASMILGAFAAIGQTNIKRLMAYSSIANIGFALVGLAAQNEQGVQGVLVYLAIYMAMTLGTFAAILAMRRNGAPVENINELAGLSQTNPSMAFILLLLFFSLAGIPPLAGFFGKYYVFLAAVKAGLWPLAVLGVIASVVGAFYYLNIVKIMYFDEAKPAFAHVDRNVFLVMAACGLFVVLFIAAPSPLVDAALAAAKSLKP
jgi:NADH-quinone oxidoreductase subunit N